ncbi:hypothetical protein [Enterobacter roggenkampii]|uniref:hypothetical protein n=1 Tax=Enterobacter roggenkampii TaxID=1812935 RepID=UPI002DB5B5B1|nr:hypothetical protein [Enterobacter roggenkampii]MEB5890007.1 hypothetical protein [Enterobacter roggenkampii]
MPYASVNSRQKKPAMTAPKNMYIYLDEMAPPGKMPPTMYANFSAVARADLWHPQEGQGKIESLMSGKEYSGNMVLVGHGMRGRAVVNMNGKKNNYNGESLAGFLKDAIPEIYRRQTKHIFALQCNASLPRREKVTSAADGVVTQKAIEGSSLTASLAQSLSSDKGDWPNVQAVHGNKWITVYKASVLQLNANNMRTLGNGVEIGFGEVDKITDPKSYKTTEKIA